VITATFVGYQVGAALGALVASVAVFLPSFLLVLGLAPGFAQLRRYRRFRAAVQGVLAAFVGLLAAATVQIAVVADWTPVTTALALGALVALRWRRRA
jgi:chromate transporter